MLRSDRGNIVDWYDASTCRLNMHTDTHRPTSTCTYMIINVHTYMYIHVRYMHTCKYIHTCTYIHVHKYMYMHTCTYIHVHPHMYIHTYMHAYTHTHTSLHAYMHTYMNMYRDWDHNGSTAWYSNGYVLLRWAFWTTSSPLVSLIAHPFWNVLVQRYTQTGWLWVNHKDGHLASTMSHIQAVA